MASYIRRRKFLAALLGGALGLTVPLRVHGLADEVIE